MILTFFFFFLTYHDVKSSELRMQETQSSLKEKKIKDPFNGRWQGDR